MLAVLHRVVRLVRADSVGGGQSAVNDDVIAFTVDQAYMAANQHRGLPVVAYEEVHLRFPPSHYRMFIPISFKKMNHIRAAKYDDAKSRGYELISYVSSRTTTFPDFTCGDNCFIFEDNTIQPFVVIGNDVVMWISIDVGEGPPDVLLDLLKVVTGLQSLENQTGRRVEAVDEPAFLIQQHGTVAVVHDVDGRR